MAVGTVEEWLVVQTHPCRERWAAINVRRQNHEFYLPEIYSRDHKRREPLFASYLFVRVISRSYAFLRSTLGVAHVVMGTANQPAVVSDQIITELRERENDHGVITLPKDMPINDGDEVVVKAGYLFGGEHGIYDGMVSKDRCRVLMRNMFAITVEKRLLERV